MGPAAYVTGQCASSDLRASKICPFAPLPISPDHMSLMATALPGYGKEKGKIKAKCGEINHIA